jgi:signal transduction histidine kinase
MQQSKVIAEMLTQAAELFRAPRALLLWEEDEEPWLCTGYWSAEGVAFDKLPPSAFAPPVATELEHLSFSSRSVEAARPTTLARTARGVMRLRGPLLHAELRRRFPMRSVLSAPVSAPGFRGRLFVIDGRNTRADDLVLCEIFVRQLSVHLAQVELLRRMQRSAEADARTQLGRELHDGVVQSLTVAALRLEAAQHQLPPDSPLRGQLAEVEQLLGDEQEEMRRFIRDYRPRSGVHAMSLVPLPERVEDLRRRIASHWGLRVEVVCSPDAERIPGAVAHEIYRIAQESLVNAARHGEASAAQVEISSDGDRARLVVADNGHGFAFRGRYDLAALNERKLGPLMLKQRVASMSGNLVIESTSAGARLEIDLPMSRTEELA